MPSQPSAPPSERPPVLPKGPIQRAAAADASPWASSEVRAALPSQSEQPPRPPPPPASARGPARRAAAAETSPFAPRALTPDAGAAPLPEDSSAESVEREYKADWSKPASLAAEAPPEILNTLSGFFTNLGDDLKHVLKSMDAKYDDAAKKMEETSAALQSLEAKVDNPTAAVDLPFCDASTAPASSSSRKRISVRGNGPPDDGDDGDDEDGEDEGDYDDGPIPPPTTAHAEGVSSEKGVKTRRAEAEKIRLVGWPLPPQAHRHLPKVDWCVIVRRW